MAAVAAASPESQALPPVANALAPGSQLIAIDWGTSPRFAPSAMDAQGAILDRLSAPADGVMAMAGRDYAAVFQTLFGRLGSRAGRGR